MEKVKKEPIRSERRNTKVIRINNIDVEIFKKAGGGNMHKGIEEVTHTYQLIKRDPEKLCMAYISDFMTAVRKYYGDDCFSNLANFSAMVCMGLRRGGHLDPSILDEEPNPEDVEKKDVENEKVNS